MQCSNKLLQAYRIFRVRYRFLNVLAAMGGLLAVLAACWLWGSRYDAARSAAASPSATVQDPDTQLDYLAISRWDQDTDPANAVTVDLSGCDGSCEITAGGDYLLTGKLQGRVHILAKKESVHLFLQDAEIVSDSGPALYCEEAEKLTVTLLPGSENVLSDSADYRTAEEQDACLQAECDLSLNGSGALRVNGFYQDAVRSKDVLRIVEGSYTVKCKRTAFHGNDGIHITGGSFDIASEKNGFKTTKTGADGRGDIVLTGGKLALVAGRYGFYAQKEDVYIRGCTVSQNCIVETVKCAGEQVIEEGCIS